MSSPRPADRWFRLLMRCAVAGVVFVMLTALVTWRMSWMTPSWYQPPADLPQTRDLAGQVENRLVEEVHRIRPPERTWTVRLRQEHINAWLAARLPQWIEHDADLDWPEFLGTPQVRLTEHGIDIAADLHINPDQSPRFLVARLTPRIDDDGIAFDLHRVGAGRIVLPGNPLAEINQRLPDLNDDFELDDDVQQFLQQLSVGDSVLTREIDLADDRIVRIIDLLCRDGSLDVVLQTLPPDAGRVSPATRVLDHRR